MAAMYELMLKSLAETVVFKGDEDTFESLFDKLVSLASVKNSMRLDDKPVRAGAKRDPNATEVDALSKGGKAKSGRGKRVTCWVCNKTSHVSRDGNYNKDK